MKLKNRLIIALRLATPRWWMFIYTLALILLGSSTFAFADNLYKCVGEGGKVTYHPQPQTGSNCIELDSEKASPSGSSPNLLVDAKLLEMDFSICSKEHNIEIMRRNTATIQQVDRTNNTIVCHKKLYNDAKEFRVLAMKKKNKDYKNALLTFASTVQEQALNLAWKGDEIRSVYDARVAKAVHEVRKTYERVELESIHNN